MNLYKIKFIHYSKSYIKEGVVTFVFANNDEEVYEWIKTNPRLEHDSIYSKWQYREDEAVEYDLYDEKINHIGKIPFKDYIISVSGDMYSEYEDLNDLYYSKILYGWEKIGLVDAEGYLKITTTKEIN